MSERTKHTPGPWKAEPYNLRMGSLISYGDISKGETVAITVAQQDPQIGKADARLIAAAPDLLEALKAVLPFVEDERDVREQSYLPEPSRAEEGWLQAANDAVNIIRAAIAKAEGADR